MLAPSSPFSFSFPDEACKVVRKTIAERINEWLGMERRWRRVYFSLSGSLLLCSRIYPQATGIPSLENMGEWLSFCLFSFAGNTWNCGNQEIQGQWRYIFPSPLSFSLSLRVCVNIAYLLCFALKLNSLWILSNLMVSENSSCILRYSQYRKSCFICWVEGIVFMFFLNIKMRKLIRNNFRRIPQVASTVWKSSVLVTVISSSWSVRIYTRISGV